MSDFISANMNLGVLVSYIISFSAIILAILSFGLNRRALLISAITKQRIEWIESVRKAITEFISVYLNSTDEILILEKKVQVELFLSPEVPNSKIINRSHQKVLKALDCCVDNFENREMKKEYVAEVVEESKKMLNMAWLIMKREAWMSKRFESSRGKKVIKTLENQGVKIPNKSV